MAKTYIHLDDGADVDPFWQTTVPPSFKNKSIDDLLCDLKKSFYKNAEKIDFVATKEGNFTIGKIGTNNENTEYRVWKSYEHIHETNMVEEIFKTNNQEEAIDKFNEVTNGSFVLKSKTQGSGMQSRVFEQPEIGKSELETFNSDKDSVQEAFDYMAKSNFARNAEKIDFVPMNDGKVLVLGMIGKSQIDRNSKYRIWKTYDHWKNENVEYLTEDMDRRTALKEFLKITGEL